MTAAPVPGGQELPFARSVLVVCAHPDDESFGLGAVLDGFVARGTQVAVLCFTHGEASTLGVPGPELGELRRAELTGAAGELGVGRVELADHPDGSLTSTSLDRLTPAVATMADEVAADLLVVFDENGVSGHPDHRRATEAALAGAPALAALAWVIPEQVADTLNATFGTAFVGRPADEIDITLQVDRACQCRAIARHESQCTDNPVLEQRLRLLGDVESLRWLRRIPVPVAPRRAGVPGAPTGREVRRSAHDRTNDKTDDRRRR